MDGAILFSDILMLPYALGQKLAFHEGEGPVLERIEDPAGVARLDPGRVASALDPVFETARRVRGAPTKGYVEHDERYPTGT
jgi:uroporphyrinogen decarboxylase